jgi:hypothetical protein
MMEIAIAVVIAFVLTLLLMAFHVAFEHPSLDQRRQVLRDRYQRSYEQRDAEAEERALQEVLRERSAGTSEGCPHMSQVTYAETNYKHQLETGFRCLACGQRWPSPKPGLSAELDQEQSSGADFTSSTQGGT